MHWVELSVDALPEYVEPLSQVFRQHGEGEVVIEYLGGFNPDEGESPPIPQSVTVKTFLPLDSTVEDRYHRIDVSVRLVAHVAEISPLRVKVIGEDDWQQAWKEHFHVLRVGKHLVIVPTWRDYQPKKSDVVIGLDPGVAFGTGHHPTTRMCLELLEELVDPGMSVLDVGCGSGILSIAAAKLGAKRVLALETDSMAAKAAEENVLQNQTDHTVKVVKGTLPSRDVASEDYHIAVANISTKVLSELSDDIAGAVKPGGYIVASGILLKHRDSVTFRLGEAGALVERSQIDGDWVSLVAVKS